jgi:hypothetical protein
MIYSTEKCNPNAERANWPFLIQPMKFSKSEQAELDKVYSIWAEAQLIKDEREREIVREALFYKQMEIENACLSRTFIGSPEELEAKLRSCWKENYLTHLRTKAFNHPIFKDLN